MRNFFLPYRPLPRKVIAACHFLIQLAVLVAGSYWLTRDGFEQPWQHWATGGGTIVAALVVVRLLGEFWMLPHYLLAQQSAASGRNAIITRSFDKRPGTRLEPDDAIGSARVVQQDTPTTRSEASRETPHEFGNKREAPASSRGPGRGRHEKPERTEPKL
ncbi:hypothetical protein [Phytohalomonas tamaricis]|uniref:hypothetical protein n=1 Tax=Phytohalomonas tamaricis TaxID=2081032 RepID=UPI000D0AFAC4|nr:hypothetical protein [Phytohalomonas tamaricis]